MIYTDLVRDTLLAFILSIGVLAGLVCGFLLTKLSASHAVSGSPRSGPVVGYGEPKLIDVRGFIRSINTQEMLVEAEIVSPYDAEESMVISVRYDEALMYFPPESPQSLEVGDAVILRLHRSPGGLSAHAITKIEL